MGEDWPEGQLACDEACMRLGKQTKSQGRQEIGVSNEPTPEASDQETQGTGMNGESQVG